MDQGNFIVFSGGEGSGKTTALNQLKAEFPHIVTTREPGGTPVGQRIRSILLEDTTLDPHVMTEMKLFMADRWENVERVIRPALLSGNHVVSDRHWMDTFAYQWYATMGETDVTEFVRRFVRKRWPQASLWVWFDVDPLIGLERRRKTDEQNRIDVRDLDFHKRLREGFRLLYEDYPYPSSIVRIDANQSIDDVYKQLKQSLESLLTVQRT